MKSLKIGKSFGKFSVIRFEEGFEIDEEDTNAFLLSSEEKEDLLEFTKTLVIPPSTVFRMEVEIFTSHLEVTPISYTPEEGHEELEKKILLR